MFGSEKLKISGEKLKVSGLDDRTFDASTQKMNTANKSHRLSIVPNRVRQDISGATQRENRSTVTILDRTNVEAVLNSSAIAGAGKANDRPSTQSSDVDMAEREIAAPMGYVSGATLLAAGICGLAVGLLWGRMSK